MTANEEAEIEKTASLKPRTALSKNNVKIELAFSVVGKNKKYQQ